MRNGKTKLKVSTQIELRLPDLLFADELFKIVDQYRIHLRQWLSWVDQTQSKQQIDEFLKMSRIYNIGGQRLTTFIFKKEKLLGSIALVKINPEHKYAEIGYWIREDFQGQGIVTQSCQALINYAFRHLDLNRIEIKTASKNFKSLAIPLKLGFTHEATLREALFLYDTFHDLELFSLLKKDWEKLLTGK
ncbi:MAG: ribosomal-protein-serine acetyltransferase [Saprospiraceae bacterium]|jgi:ribosomal-protein-serine acetyltransferase